MRARAGVPRARSSHRVQHGPSPDAPESPSDESGPKKLIQPRRRGRASASTSRWMTRSSSHLSLVASPFAMHAVSFSAVNVSKRVVLARASAERQVERVERPACAKACDEGAVADGARVDMAKAKCVHPDRPVAKACGDCPRRK